MRSPLQRGGGLKSACFKNDNQLLLTEFNFIHFIQNNHNYTTIKRMRRWVREGRSQWVFPTVLFRVCGPREPPPSESQRLWWWSPGWPPQTPQSSPLGLAQAHQEPRKSVGRGLFLVHYGVSLGRLSCGSAQGKMVLPGPAAASWPAAWPERRLPVRGPFPGCPAWASHCYTFLLGAQR